MKDVATGGGGGAAAAGHRGGVVKRRDDDRSGLVIHTHNEGGVDRIPHNTHAKQAQNPTLLARRADTPRTNTQPRVRHVV